MAWTEERVALLKQYWEEGRSASQIAELLGDGLSRNAVIGKAHRMGLSARPSPLKTDNPKAGTAAGKEGAGKAARASGKRTKAAPRGKDAGETGDAGDAGAATVTAAATDGTAASGQPGAAAPEEDAAETAETAPAALPPAQSQPAQPAQSAQSATVAAPTVHASGKKPRKRAKGAPVTLLDLNDRICKWPIGHPDEASFHFCGKAVNPGFPYCLDHCLVAYQAQLPRRERGDQPRPSFTPNLPRPR